MSKRDRVHVNIFFIDIIKMTIITLPLRDSCYDDDTCLLFSKT